jgi:DNA repair exonuclease SbcCD ATPase subunit
MFLKKITISNIRNFKDELFHHFHPVNLIIGEVGSGKSTLGRIAPVFCLFGKCGNITIKNLKNKESGDKQSSFVECLIEHKKDVIKVRREIPNKVNIWLNGIEQLEEANASEKNKWLVNRFGDYEYFQKFRMIDITEGINILESGKTDLRKTLISFNESILNNIRGRLQNKKALYERFNKSNSMVFNHFPSEKRFNFLKDQLKNISTKLNNIRNEESQISNEIYSLNSQKSRINADINSFENKINKIKIDKKCPTCYQILPEKTSNIITEDVHNQISELKQELTNIIKELPTQIEALNFIKNKSNKINQRLYKIREYITKLEGRLKQKDYIYTEKDILLISNAIKKLDEFYSFYILNSVKVLEPVINSILIKLGFEVSFRLDDRNNFDIVLIKQSNGLEYSYEELSSGQKLMLSIAFQLSLLLQKGETGLLIADEGFNNFAESDCIFLYNMFKDMPFQLISILHRFSTTDDRNLNIIDLNKQ